MEVMSRGPSSSDDWFIQCLLEKRKASTQGLPFVHPNNKLLKKDLANVPEDGHLERS